MTDEIPIWISLIPRVRWRYTTARGFTGRWKFTIEAHVRPGHENPFLEWVKFAFVEYDLVGERFGEETARAIVETHNKMLDEIGQ